MSNGLKLENIKFHGQQTEPVSVSFPSLFNVVSGSSETGKSYLFEAVDFVFGRKELPRPIEEARGYESVSLSLRTNQGEHYTLMRSLLGGDIRLVRGEGSSALESKVLSARHAAGHSQSVSGFLLGLSGLADKKLKKNASNETDNLTFRKLLHYVMVDEERILSRESPIYTGQYTSQTADVSLFRLLLTGVDAGSLVADVKPEIRRAQLNAQIDLLAQFISEREAELVGGGNKEELEQSLERLSNSIDSQKAEAASIEAVLVMREAERRDKWRQIERARSNIVKIVELLDRFVLLKERYKSDISRIIAVAEAGQAFDGLDVAVCPYCGASPEEQHRHETWDGFELKVVQESCQVELAKVQALIGDLDQTIEDTTQELSSYRELERSLEGELKVQSRAIDELLSPLRDLHSSLSVLMDKQKHFERLVEKWDELADLRRKSDACRDMLSHKPRKSSRSGEGMNANEVTRFCDQVHTLLRAWEYPDVNAVLFSEKRQDIVLGNRNRGDQGKGLRAISHAAFVIGLMEYCLSEGRPHPGFVLLDSPLVTYRKPDTPEGEALSDGAVFAFYRDLGKRPLRGQVIVLENEDPPMDVVNQIGYTHFTKSNNGRYGLFPLAG